eukprot:6609110-Pyramimonas_sp.AAC.1
MLASEREASGRAGERRLRRAWGARMGVAGGGARAKKGGEAVAVGTGSGRGGGACGSLDNSLKEEATPNSPRICD